MYGAGQGSNLVNLASEHHTDQYVLTVHVIIFSGS